MLRSKIEGPDARDAVDVASAVEDARVAGGDRAPARAPQASQPVDDKRVLLDELKSREEELRAVQGETPLVHAEVNSQAISETVAAWTGIPVGRMMADQISTVLNLKSLMERQIVGQSHALERIAQSSNAAAYDASNPATISKVFTAVLSNF